MSKIYLAAVNWEKAKGDHPYSGVSVFDAPCGTDIAHYTTYYKVDEWRIYPFTTKRERDALVDDILSKKEGDNK